MAGLPQLIEEDVVLMDSVLDEFLGHSEAAAALIIDKGGPLISQRGSVDKFDTTTVAALAAGAFAAQHMIAERLGETSLAHIYQQGQRHSLLISNIDENLLLIVIFPVEMSVGAIKYYADAAISRIADQMKKAALREPGANLDLVSMNVLDVSGVFRKNE